MFSPLLRSYPGPICSFSIKILSRDNYPSCLYSVVNIIFFMPFHVAETSCNVPTTLFLINSQKFFLQTTSFPRLVGILRVMQDFGIEADFLFYFIVSRGDSA
jgi:hypothetical protein